MPNVQHPADRHQNWRDLLPMLDQRVAEMILDDAAHGTSDRALLTMARQAIELRSFEAECDRVHAEIAPNAPTGVDRSGWWQPDNEHPEIYREVTLSDVGIAGTRWHVRTIVDVSVSGRVSEPTVEILISNVHTEDRLTVAQAAAVAAALTAVAHSEVRAA